MPVALIRTYEARCDCENCYQGGDNFLDRKEVIAEVAANGWLVRGRKLYCPKCRSKYEPKQRPK